MFKCIYFLDILSFGLRQPMKCNVVNRVVDRGSIRLRFNLTLISLTVLTVF